jgi:hypothetical protein
MLSSSVSRIKNAAKPKRVFDLVRIRADCIERDGVAVQ